MKTVFGKSHIEHLSNAAAWLFENRPHLHTKKCIAHFSEHGCDCGLIQCYVDINAVLNDLHKEQAAPLHVKILKPFRDATHYLLKTDTQHTVQARLNAE